MSSGLQSYGYSYAKATTMAEPILVLDRLDVYRISIDCVASPLWVAQDLNGLHRHPRDQWFGAVRSIPRNISEGNGKRSLEDRHRFLGRAQGSALEGAVIQNALAATDGIDDE